jgi:hypothetical protein
MATIWKDVIVLNVVGGDTPVYFNDFFEAPTGAQSWAIDDMPGWDDTPDIDVQLSQVAGVDGEIMGDVQTARARHVIVSGYVKAPDRATSEILRDILVRDAFPRNKDMTLTRYEGVPKFLKVRRSGPIEITPPMPEVAQDPFKYSLDPVIATAGAAGLSTGGRTYPRTYPLTYTIVSGSADIDRAVVENIGTVASAPIIDLTGPLSKGGWRLSNETTGEDLFLDIGLATTDELDIDFATEVVRLNGFVVNPATGGDFWRVEPGINIIKLYASYDPGTTFTITNYSAWE